MRFQGVLPTRPRPRNECSRPRVLAFLFAPQILTVAAEVPLPVLFALQSKKIIPASKGVCSRSPKSESVGFIFQASCAVAFTPSTLGPSPSSSEIRSRTKPLI